MSENYKDKNFVHLHVHSEYSLLDGAIRFPQLVKTVADMGMDAVAVTDHGVMYGCCEFFEKATESGIKPILGCEVYVDPRGHEKREGSKNNHLLLLAENLEGYHNLVKLVSAANTDGFYYKPRVDHGLLSKYSKGIIASSACIAGEIPSLLITGNDDAALERAYMYKDIFGEGNFFLEIMYNEITEQAIANKGLIHMSRKYGFPLIATNDAHYLKREDASWHDVLLCVQTKSTVDTPGRYRFSGDDFYLRSPQEMWGLFGGEVPDALTNTLKIAARCDVKLKLGEYSLPDFAVPEGKSLADYLREMSLSGLAKRLGVQNIADIPPRYADRLHFELGVITQMGFPGYFCIVADIIAAAKSAGIPVGPGRGSAAGSVVAWALGITELDPLEYNLLFERFLNPERISMPDIDTDISDKRRDEVLSYIVSKYGSDKVAQIITFDRMKSKAAIRDTGRALGVPLSEVNRASKLIPFGAKSIEDAMQKTPELRQMAKENESIAKLLATAGHIEGIARHSSQHAAGVVITPLPIADMVPIKKTDDGQVSTQYSMEPIEHLGLVKMDFLGLRTLSVIEDTLANLAISGKPPVDILKIPLDDQKTFEMLKAADTLGVFQLESAGMQDLLRRMKPDSFEDLIAILALYRPGPLGSGMVDDYIDRKHGKSAPVYPHPKLEESLKETYGVMLYQEQVMQCASTLAGFTLGEADLLRRAMGKKKADVMEKQREKFVEGAKRNGVDASKAAEIFSNMEKFAEYGFNKSHSAAYALISYQTAYLKANYGAEFLAAYLSSMIGAKTDVLGSYIREVKENSYPVLPPDINHSREQFTVVGSVIRFGLGVVSRLGAAAVENILKVRNAGGPFSSLFDFLCRIDSQSANKAVTENLIKAGAFDELCANRNKLLQNLPSLMEIAQKKNERRNQVSIFAMDEAQDNLIPEMEDCAELSLMEKLDMEKEVLGLYISGHPFEQLAKNIIPYLTCPIKDAYSWCSTEAQPVLGGMLTSMKEKFTKRGEAMGILEFEDMDATIEAVCFPKQWAKLKPSLKTKTAYIFSGNFKNDGRISILIEEIQQAENYADNAAQSGKKPSIKLKINAPKDGAEDFFKELSRELKGHAGNCALLITIEDEQSSALLRPKGYSVSNSAAFREKIEEMFGGRVLVEG